MIDKLKAGDLVFVEFFPEKWIYKTMAKLQQFFDRTKFHHVAIYIGNGYISEMSDKGRRKVKLPIQDNIRLGIMRCYLEPTQEQVDAAITEYNKTHKSKDYPDGELFQVGLSVFVNYFFRNIRISMLKDGDNDICSAYVNNIYKIIGNTLVPYKNPSVGQLERSDILFEVSI